MDTRTKQIILSQAVNLSQNECLHLNQNLVDKKKIKETAKEYYQLIVDLNEEILDITEKKKLRLKL